MASLGSSKPENFSTPTLCAAGSLIPDSRQGRVQEFESLDLLVAEGWR